MISSGDIAFVFFILLLLMGIMYSLLFLAKKYLYNQGGKNGSQLNMQVLATQTLMPKKFLSIVRVSDKFFLLGISEHSINLIDKLDDFSVEDLELQKNERKGLSFFEQFKKRVDE
ncbi:MAG: flagellar biosynthetic protein FliO [Chlorobi bacterium]|nr:flagellar biosynthetic protein FliO [Chlorobiota bacterium]